MGPYILVDSIGGQATVRTHNGTIWQIYSVYQEKPYYQDTYKNINFFNSKRDEYIPTDAVNIEVIGPHYPRAWNFDFPK